MFFAAMDRRGWVRTRYDAIAADGMKEDDAGW